MKTSFFYLFIILVFTVGDLPAQQSYSVVRVDQPIAMDADWDKPVWKNVLPISLTHHMGEKPNHFPGVQAKLVYDDRYIYVIWKVDDQYVRAVAKKHQDPVFQDSCVEFFFSPGPSVDQGYFNLEMNCGGMMLFKQRASTDKPFVEIRDKHLNQIQVAHSLPKRVPDEIKQKTTWYLEYAIPFSILKEYYELETPSAGTTWRANFYKCADKTSHPHWITWSEVQYPKPQFHLPEFFGTLTFK